MIGNTDTDWERLAQADPYWAVLTDPKFRGGVLTDDAKREFFGSGEGHVRLVLDTVARHIAPGFAPRRCLDFGCGVGRLVLPLATRFAEVVGVDVSEAMLTEAKRNADAAGLANATFVRGDDDLTTLSGRFDLVHSHIVFQHIPPARGEVLFRRLVDLLSDDGVGVLHVVYSTERRVGSASDRIRRAIKERVRRSLVRLGLLAPKMQMNEYDLNRLLGVLQEAGTRRLFVELTDHGGERGAVLFFRKEPASGYRA